MLNAEVKKQKAVQDKFSEAKFSWLTPEEALAKKEADRKARAQAKAKRDAKWWAAEKERERKFLEAEAAKLKERRALLAKTTVWSKIASKKPEMAPLPAPVARPLGCGPDDASWSAGFAKTMGPSFQPMILY